MSELLKIYFKTDEICTDSRAISPNSIFWALKGEKFDANYFAEKALEDGAAYAVISDPKLAEQHKGDSRYIYVENSLKSLQDLALEYRMTMDIPVIALSGTNGKTTTKELLRALLSKKYKVHATSGNLNNHIGVPLTLLSMPIDTEIAVIEMGASSPGEIKTLCNIARPTHGLLTNVGIAHIQGFGSFEGVKKAKGELYDFLNATDGKVFLNVDNLTLVNMAHLVQPEFIHKYGCEYEGFHIAPVDVNNPFLRLITDRNFSNTSTDNILGDSNKIEILTNLIGSYNADNVLAAWTVAYYFNISTEQMLDVLKSYYPSNNRSQLEKTEHNVLIVDAYNANPSSMDAALDNFNNACFDNKIVILGDMLELGHDSEIEHKKVILKLEMMNLEAVYLVGAEFEAVRGDNVSKNSNNIHYLSDVKALTKLIANFPLKEKTILIKGSNGIHLTDIIKYL
ncbi:MAG: UDP-N-acetylmuramoyl-tripeptide--D-alanyl-D-alanine ligase [Bacteroidales bacterium]